MQGKRLQMAMHLYEWITEKAEDGNVIRIAMPDGFIDLTVSKGEWPTREEKQGGIIMLEPERWLN